MKPNELVLGSVNLGQYAAVAVQPNWIFQWIQLALAIACSVVLLAYRLWKWWKEAKQDGKITKEELKEGIDIIIDGANDIKGHLDNKEDKKE